MKTSLFLPALAGIAAAQFPPKLDGVKTVTSKHHPGVKISYKEPGICETTPGVKSYAGHVHLPAGYLEDAASDYPVNTFFWFFEARKDPKNAPLSIWLNGGPGSSSMLGLLSENGPCLINADSATSRINPWSWNNEVNMLYIDEPTQVGFSYDVATNCTYNLAGENGGTKPADFSDGVPPTNLTHRVGTFSSQDTQATANNTQHAAHAMWHFAQTFFSEFPEYKPNDDRVSLWAESYGGHYGPRFMSFFQQQNEKIANGTLDDEHAHYLHLDTLGIVNGIMDQEIQNPSYISFPYNNTYGIQVFNQSLYEELMHNFTKPDGCKDQYIRCRKSLEEENRRNGYATIASSKALCDIADWCDEPSETIYQSRDFGWLDIANPHAEPFPPNYLHGYLTQSDVLQALGSPVNFTSSSRAVSKAFHNAFDAYEGGFLDAIGYLLDSGVKVHMMYGDRDYACSWVGGEAASLEVPYKRIEDFRSAGYVELLTSAGEFKGMTRQHGNYSFTRVFQSGHLVPAYQPEAAYDIFMRSLFNKDIATGQMEVRDDLKTSGPSSTWHIKQEAPTKPKPECYILAPESCPPEVWAKVVDGTAPVKDFLVVDSTEDNDEL